MGKILKKSTKVLSRNQCAVYNCLNTAKTPNVAFHNFPSIKAVRDKWKVFCEVEYSDYLCKKYKLCSAHFTPDCFDSNTQEQSNPNPTLNELAVPTIKTSTQHNDSKLTYFNNTLNILRCRVCLTARGDLESIFNGEKMNHANKIEQCVQIDIRVNDGLPQYICVECIQLLENAHRFKILCEQSNQTLQLEVIDQNKAIKIEQTSDGNELNIKDLRLNLCDLQPKEEEEMNSAYIPHNDVSDEDDIDGSENNSSVPNNIDCDRSELDTKYDSDSVENENSGDSDWNMPVIITKKEKVPKEVKVKLPKVKKKRKKEIKIKVQCDECGFLTVGSTNLKDHKRAVHQGITDFYKCEQCPKAFKQRVILQVHMKVVHQINPVVCDICGKSFKNNILLGNHKKTHSAEKKYKCEFCPYITASKPTLRKHTTIHTGERKYQCQICDRSFRLSGLLHTHIQSVHKKLKPFKCEICEKSFANKSRLQKHGVVHSGLRPFPCPICPNVTYSWYVALVGHQRSLHPELKLETETVLYKKFFQGNN